MKLKKLEDNGVELDELGNFVAKQDVYVQYTHAGIYAKKFKKDQRLNLSQMSLLEIWVGLGWAYRR